ncbi:MAG TPA: PKD-like domain-containing protein, partial [Bacteroidia bacterium]|nr:PKD-like domain-containing protein [Bacteroidia bacterium]
VLYMTNSDVFNIPNGGSLNLKLTSSYSANYAITLNVNPNVTVTGTNTNDSISQTFTNLTNQTQTITYTIKPTSTVGGCVGISQTITVTIPGACINGCDPIECTDCIGSFAPDIGATYVISAWVQQANSAQLMTYSEPALAVAFTGGASQGPFHASGVIIDGWQRIDTTFTVPAGATEVFVKLVNTGDNEAYFDDLRVQPLKASLKSFVYDPVSMRLMAELDENNYATFYEYDEEGALIRVKKETERGIKTIKETGNNTHKNQ